MSLAFPWSLRAFWSDESKMNQRSLDGFARGLFRVGATRRVPFRTSNVCRAAAARLHEGNRQRESSLRAPDCAIPFRSSLPENPEASSSFAHLHDRPMPSRGWHPNTKDQSVLFFLRIKLSPKARRYRVRTVALSNVYIYTLCAAAAASAAAISVILEERY